MYEKNLGFALFLLETFIYDLGLENVILPKLNLELVTSLLILYYKLLFFLGKSPKCWLSVFVVFFVYLFTTCDTETLVFM